MKVNVKSEETELRKWAIEQARFVAPQQCDVSGMRLGPSADALLEVAEKIVAFICRQSSRVSSAPRRRAKQGSRKSVQGG